MSHSLDSSRHREEFERQLRFLNKRIREFDEGDLDEAIAASTVIRTLVHNATSVSLFRHMRIENDIKLFTATSGVNARNSLTTESLTQIRVGPDGAQKLPLDPELFALIRHPVSLQSWWEMPVIQDLDLRLWTRKDLILNLVHKAGGAHLEDFEEKELVLRAGTSFGWSVSVNGKAIGFDESPWLPSAQTIARELAYSMEKWLEENPA